jgi:hypothetical protein
MIDKIATTLSNLSPQWLSRVVARSGNTSNSEEIRKILGEPLPKVIDPQKLPKELAVFFSAYGVLQRIKKKLANLTRKAGKLILPAKGTIACVDSDDNVYVGVEFLQAFGNDEALLAGVLAHEWGHMISELPPGSDLSHLNWDQLFEIRREEESDADAFAGRALFKMGYKVDNMLAFLSNLQKLDEKFQTQKYHSAAVRMEIVRQAFLAEARMMESAKKMVFSPHDGYKNPDASILIGVG